MESILPLSTDERENHAKAFALAKAHEVRGEIVDLVLNRTGVNVSGLSLPDLEEAEQFIERRLAGLLKSSLTSFCEIWTKELERRLDALNKINEDALRISR